MTAENHAVDESDEDSGGSGCVIVTGVALIAIGVWILLSNARSASVAQEAKSWTKTPCRIVAAELVSQTGSDQPVYRTDFTYAYQVDGKNYVGKRDSVLTTYSKHSVAQDRLRALPVGAEAVCYVNPNDPADAILDRSVSGGELLIFWVFGGSAIAMGAWFIVGTIRLLLKDK